MREELEIRNKADIDDRYPIISIIGRPNVGKSTLFNRFLGKRVAITDPTSGVTRDPIPKKYLLGNNPVTLVDSGGVKVDMEGLDYKVSEKSLSLCPVSSLILLVMDATEVTGEDMMLLEHLRPYSDKLILVVNKIDDETRRDLLWHFYSYGYQRVVGISAAQGLGFEELEETMMGMLSLEEQEEEPEEGESLKIAILGKPNTGKSTLMNVLTGRDISIVSDIAGTTRDVMEGSFEYKGNDFTLLDTAGIRRKSKVEEDVEYYSVNRAIKTIEEASVVFLMIDAKEGLADQDKKIAELIVREGKGIILVMNKIDLLSGIHNEEKAIEDRIRFLFPVLSFAPVVFISAKNKKGIIRLLDTAIKLSRELETRVDTSVFNDALKAWTSKVEPPRGKEGHYKVLYGTQVSSSPVRFLLFVNRIKGFPDAYISYIKNMIREDFGFADIPVEISLRERRRNPSLYQNGNNKEEVEVKKIINENKDRKKGLSKGKRGGVGNKAKISRQREKAKKIVKEKKTRKS